jgi:hypothetical protein
MCAGCPPLWISATLPLPMPHRQLKHRPTIAPMVRPASPHRERGLEMLRAGATAAQVAAELGVPLTSAKAWARSLGLRAPGKRGPDQKPRSHVPRGPDRALRDPRAEALPVIDLLLQGVSIGEIAASLKRSYQAVVEIRDRWIGDEQ